MNWDQIEGQWTQAKGHVKSKWGKLTDDDVTNVAGKKDVLVGKLQERYGMLKQHAESQVDTWIDKLNLTSEAGKDAADKPK